MKNYNLKLLVTFPIKKAPHLHGVTKQALFRRTVPHQAQAVKRKRYKNLTMFSWLDGMSSSALN